MKRWPTEVLIEGWFPLFAREHERFDEARIPPAEREAVLKRELAVRLYARELLPKAAARRLSGMVRVAFDDLLGQRGVPSRLTVEDFDEDLADLAAFRRAAGSGGPA